MFKPIFTLEDISNRDITILNKSGIKYSILQDPYDHTIKNAEFNSEEDKERAMELLNN